MKTNAAIYFVALWLAGIGAALAQAQTNAIESFNVTEQSGKVIVRITTKEPLKSVPPNFAVANPARIAFDFANTANALGRSTQDIGQGELRSMNVVQGSDRTRLVLNLRRSVTHEATLDGRTVVVTLTPTVVSQTGPSGQVAHFAEGRADTKHQIRDIDFRRGRSGEGRIIIDLSDTSTGIDIRQQGQNIIVEFLKTTLPGNLRRRLDVVDFATPVNVVSAYQQGENVRVVIEPKGQWEHNAYQSDTQFVVEVKAISADASRATRRDRYTGEKLSLNFQNVEVRAVLNVQDTPSRLDEVRKLIAKIDIPVRQVMIEARIVEASDTFSKNLGVRLGLVETGQPNRGVLSTNTGIRGPIIGGSIGSTNTQLAATTGGTLAANSVAVTANQVNLPATGLNGFNAGQFSFILFNAGLTRFLNVELTALEADGKGKIISNLRVLTADQVEATIEQGTEIPYQQATSSGATSVSFRKANLSLKVKPQITPDGNVIMALDVNNDAPGATTTAGVQINTKHVKTEVLVENGGTVVIGGIYQQTDRTDITRVPFLGDLPYIGFLFRNNTSSSTKTELLVFITPRVVNERLTIR
jgi:type II secretory pathway component HofQ